MNVNVLILNNYEGIRIYIRAPQRLTVINQIHQTLDPLKVCRVSEDASSTGTFNKYPAEDFLKERNRLNFDEMILQISFQFLI